MRISRANLAAAVANEGCAGVIASVGLSDYENSAIVDAAELDRMALAQEIRKARKQSDGVIGVNVMVALRDYEAIIRECVKEKVDMIISGAGLPMYLPGYTEGSDIPLIPIVSSLRTFKLIHRKWLKDYNRCPDAVIIEGTQAGGHLGYSTEQILQGSPTLEETLADVLGFVKQFESPIPVIVAGGIFSGEEMAHYLKLGASGVQMATRFVCTEECDADIKFKQAYLDASAQDIMLIDSPVGLPGKVIRNEFVDKIKLGQTTPFQCRYHCLRTCNPSTAPYCIAEVLAKASDGKLDESFAFAGSNAWRCTEIVSVKTLIGQIMRECESAYAENPVDVVK